MLFTQNLKSSVDSKKHRLLHEGLRHPTLIFYFILQISFNIKFIKFKFELTYISVSLKLLKILQTNLKMSTWLQLFIMQIYF